MCDKGAISDISKVVGAAIEQTSKQDRGFWPPKIKN